MKKFDPRAWLSPEELAEFDAARAEYLSSKERMRAAYDRYHVFRECARRRMKMNTPKLKPAFMAQRRSHWLTDDAKAKQRARAARYREKRRAAP